MKEIKMKNDPKSHYLERVTGNFLVFLFFFFLLVSTYISLAIAYCIYLNEVSV